MVPLALEVPADFADARVKLCVNLRTQRETKKPPRHQAPGPLFDKMQDRLTTIMLRFL